MKTPTIKRLRLPIDQIRADGGTQPRATIDEATVEDYALVATEGILPPVTVFYDGSEYWMADGFHRLAAYKSAGLTEIDVEVSQGTRRDAILFSVGANDTHGLRRTNEDKRRAVLTLLNDPEWSQWSDREIGRRAAVDPSFVGRLRASLSVDGLQMNGDGAATHERKVTRGGTTYSVNTSKIGDGRKTERKEPAIPSDDDEEDLEEQDRLESQSPDDEDDRHESEFHEPADEDYADPTIDLSPEWQDSELQRKAQVEQGETILANQRYDHELIRWAKRQGIYVAIDRSGYPLGNPLRIGDPAPGRDAVIAWYRDHWLPFIKDQVDWELLRGKVLGCWCYPEPCHGHVLLEALAHEDR